jgi:hypothetical protein
MWQMAAHSGSSILAVVDDGASNTSLTLLYQVSPSSPENTSWFGI